MKKITTKDFIEKAKQIHGDKYDYSKVEYVNYKTKVCIICPKHGEFWQNPHHHLSRKQGCHLCNGGVNLNTEEFIDKAKKIHGDKYDYSKVKYIDNRTKVCIICPEHGEFWQTPNCHLNGQGCPKCNQSKMENEISLFLKQNDIIFEQQKRFNWLGRQSLDFYLPDYNIAIECQGKQHFESRDRFGGIDGLKERIEKDKLKKHICETNNVKIIYYANYKYDFPYKVLNDKCLLLKEITAS